MEIGMHDYTPLTMSMIPYEETMTLKRNPVKEPFAKLRKLLETGVMDLKWEKGEKDTLRNMAKTYCLKDGSLYLIRGKPRRVVESREEQLQLIKSCHEDSEKDHNGISITCDKIREGHYWKNMKADVETYIAACDCRAIRAQKRAQALNPFSGIDLQELMENAPVKKKRKPNMQSCQPVLVIQTGGTIDKDYPRREGGYLFEIDESAAQRVLCRIQPSFAFTVMTVCRKDSQDITDEDRADMANVINENSAKKVLVTHGTDTMIETANFLAESCPGKTIILTGAFLPEQFKNSDAEFNLGFALGALQCLQRPGVHVAMNGRVLAHDWVTRDPETKNFVEISS